MNAQERALLTELLNNLHTAARQMPVNVTDPEAAALIQQAFAGAPNMAYLLTQRHLLLEQALQQAKARIAQLEQNNAPAPTAPSFLGAAAAPAQTNAWGQPIGRSPAMNAVPNETPAPVMAANASRGFGGGSFLGTAAAAATGVLGGALLFQGIEHLMGGGGYGNGLAQAPVEDITNVTENFYGADSANPDPAGDSADLGGWQNANYDDPSVNPFDSTGADPSAFDSAGLDDASGGGGFFDGLFGGGDDDWV